MKKYLALFLALTMVLSFGSAAMAETTYTPGGYTGTGTGMHGNVTVEVMLDETSIKSITVTEQNETYGIGCGMDTTPIEALPQQIVDTQSLNVDMICGATITSSAVLTAVKNALKEAGVDASTLTGNKASQQQDETFNADIVIAGAGAAGLAAGIEALTTGAKNVVIIEKQGIAGGATTRCGGKVLAAGSAWQTAQGYTDTADMMFDYLKSVGGELLDDEKVRTFCDASLENLTWLENLGVQIQNVEAIHSSLTPWRVHNVIGAGGMTDGHGGQFIVPMLKRYEELGGKIIYNSTVDSLLTNDEKAVVGVTAKNADGSNLTVNAGAVILATGGYAQNRALLNYSSVSGYYTSVPKGNVGDGLTLAASVGGATEVPDYTQVVYTSFTCGVGINEEAGLIVTASGERFCNEYSYQYHVGDQLAKTGSGYSYYIACPNDPNPYVLYGLSLDSTPKAETPEALAEMIGVDPAVLSATISRYNELCAKGADDDYGKPADKMVALDGPVYAAIKLSPCVTVTYGGIVTDVNSRVLTAEGEAIQGLYAAGETAFVGLFGSEYPCCGMAVGSAVYFGRVAGEQACELALGK